MSAACLLTVHDSDTTPTSLHETVTSLDHKLLANY